MQWNIPGFNLYLNSIGDGKGIASFYRSGKVAPRKHVKKGLVQISLLSNVDLDIINVYRSQGMNNAELANDLEGLIDMSKPTIICGDFNFCYIDQQDNEVTQMLVQSGFAQQVHEATHFKGGHIDHVYSNHDPSLLDVVISLYSPYYTAKDHDAICITVTKLAEKVPPGLGKYSTRKRKV